MKSLILLTPPERFSRRRLTVIVVIAALLGVVALVVALAAGAFATFEPEQGTLGGGAQVVSNSSASGGNAVQFKASATPTPTPTSSAPPPQGGYFTTGAVGLSTTLPSDSSCASQVHYSTWEPRPDNTKRNHIMPDAAAVHASFAARPVGSSYDSRWDSWLLQRVDGQFTGTTDEIFQWAACKWGVSDDIIRAMAVRESTWYQYLAYPSGRCVSNYGCGDFIPAADADTKVFCDAIDQYGHHYQNDYGSGICPETFSILGIKSWEKPSWGFMPDNQNGTFPYNRNSTAFAADYLAGHLRGCYNGWIHWLGGGASGDMWGCVGAWYSGSWHDTAGDGYISRVQTELANFTWLQPGWPTDKPGCSATYGCPGPDPY
jgi:hypothetical protein